MLLVYVLALYIWEFLFISKNIFQQVMALDLGNPYEFLSKAISPPDESSVLNALRYLDSLNAVYLISLTHTAESTYLIYSFYFCKCM